MKNIALSLLLVLGLVLCAEAQTPTVTPLVLPANSTTGSITGDISKGIKIPMTWAESSSVALVPATRFEQFNGNHVFYRIEMPARSSFKVTLVPKNGAKINLYALRQGAAGPHQVPPNVTSCISSEASYPIYANTGGGRRVSNPDDGVRKVEYISVNRPYSILIGVAGAEGLTQGEYTMNIEIKQR